ncbi:MAG: hypothetical protein ACO37F_06900 [Pirellulales bacterium]
MISLQENLGAAATNRVESSEWILNNGLDEPAAGFSRAGGDHEAGLVQPDDVFAGNDLLLAHRPVVDKLVGCEFDRGVQELICLSHMQFSSKLTPRKLRPSQHCCG